MLALAYSTTLANYIAVCVCTSSGNGYKWDTKPVLPSGISSYRGQSCETVRNVCQALFSLIHNAANIMCLSSLYSFFLFFTPKSSSVPIMYLEFFRCCSEANTLFEAHWGFEAFSSLKCHPTKCYFETVWTNNLLHTEPIFYRSKVTLENFWRGVAKIRTGNFWLLTSFNSLSAEPHLHFLPCFQSCKMVCRLGHKKEEDQRLFKVVGLYFDTQRIVHTQVYTVLK